MRVELDGAGCWERRADDPEGVDRLARAARALAALRHPGVADLVAYEQDDGGARLLTRWVGPCVSERPPTTSGQVAGIGAVAATTLADLHALGWAHGAVRADHLLIDEQGRPVWCGVGAASTEEGAQAADTAALLDLLADLCSRLHEPARAVVGALRRCRRRLEMAEVARRLADPRLGGHLPGQAAPTAQSRRGPRPGARVLVALALVAAGGAAGAVGTFGGSGSAGCPAADLGCAPLPTPGGVLTTTAGRFDVGVAHPTVVLGRWGCASTSLPAVLDDTTGRVWSWPAWASVGHPVAARLVGVVSGASGLTVEPGAGGCDRLRVDVRGRPAVTLDPGGRR